MTNRKNTMDSPESKGNGSSKSIVFLDTNSIDKNGLTPGIFGKRQVLETIADDYDIKIPRVVFHELQEHKRKTFEDEKRRLKRSELAGYLNIDTQAIEQLRFDSISEMIISKESIPYELCEMEEPEAFLDKYYQLAVQHKPPFDAGSDKGFKDACVASTIEKFLNEHDNLKHVSLVTADSRLREFFSDNPRVKTYEKIEDLPKKHSPEANPQLSNGTPLNNQAEPPRPVNTESDVNDAINAFCLSGSFASTHNAVTKLMPVIKHLTEDEKTKVLKAAATNDQISSIICDEDVKALILPLFQELESRLPDREYRILVNAIGLPDNRPDANGNAMFSIAEQRIYTQFADSLVGHILKRSWDSATKNDAEKALQELRNLLARSTLDPNSLSWQAIANVFLTGSVSVEQGIAPRDTVLDFADMLAACSPSKQTTAMNAIAARLGDVEIDYGELPF